MQDCGIGAIIYANDCIELRSNHLPTTINDIAKAANVSPSTVSRVIAKSPLISKKTCQLVTKIMKEMDYHPNMIARSLVNRATKIIGVLMPGTSDKVFLHPFFPEILRGVTGAAEKCGYHILLAGIGSEKEESANIAELVNGRIAEGLILMTSRRSDESVSELVSENFPFVMVGRPDDNLKDGICWVDNDNREAGRLLCKRFIEKGCRSTAFIGVSRDYMVTVDRLDGYKAALAESGIAFDPRLIVDGKFMDGSGSEMIKELLSRNVPFDGVIAGDDFQAFSAINYLAKRDFSVPGDIAVAGFNNVPLANSYMPPLTSVEVHACALGERAFCLLLDQIEKKDGKIGHAIVKTEVIGRDSC